VPASVSLTTLVFSSFSIQPSSKKRSQTAAPRAPPEILVLPNAWDAMSARVFESCGFRAVATTSAGIAYALGYPDGERLTRDEMAEATARVARAIEAPVSADVEAG